ncbi:unnamed protein product, partial [Rotaria sp. Silwood2]
LWQKEGNEDNQWLLRRISLHGNTDNSKSNQDDISIDDLAVNQGLCPKSIICDFESNDLCRYVNDPTNTIDWKRLQAENDSSLPSTDVTYIDFNWRRTPSHDTGPSGDHITGTGYYVYIEASTPQIPGNPTTSSCLVFFITYVRIVNTWKGDIALDDIQLNHDNCPPIGECTFEQGLCVGWETVIDDDFDWSLARNGSTPSGTPTVGSCLHLWYYLYRAEQGTLLIQQKSEIGRAKIIWTKSNDQDNIWHQKRTTVPPLLDSGTYRTLIIGIISSKPTEDMRMDDVLNIEGECPGSEVCTFVEEDFCSWLNE